MLRRTVWKFQTIYNDERKVVRRSSCEDRKPLSVLVAVNVWCWRLFGPSAGRFGHWNELYCCIIVLSRRRTLVRIVGGTIRKLEWWLCCCVGSDIRTTELVRTGLVPSICNSNELPAVPSSTVTPIGMKGAFLNFGGSNVSSLTVMGYTKMGNK